MRTIRWIVVAATALVGLAIAGQMCLWTGEAVEVAREEFGPRAALVKYEWFKDAAATLDKKRADIEVVVFSMEQVSSRYQPGARWDREDRVERNMLSAEARGLIASYNTLSAAYNSEMAKFNWRFANRGELPKGAKEPLPREFKSYRYSF